jgi:uncharacterized protein YlbG (UPF0298 family)
MQNQKTASIQALKFLVIEKTERRVNVNSPTTSTILHSINLQEPITIHLTNRLSVRLYKDTRPNCLETAALQKGLVLMLDNEELIEEGVGFGVPVVKYQDKTYFSSSAEASTQKTDSAYTLKKTYLMDTISRKKIWRAASYIDDNFYSSVRKKFEKLYLSHKTLSPLFNKLMELREIAKIKTEFIKVKPRGAIAVNYEIQPTIIKVSVDFSELTLTGCQEVLVLNEQGSSVFQKYADTSGLTLFGNNIGAWDAVTADQASMLSTGEHVAFSLQNICGAALFRGWEKTRNRFSWAGLSYSLRPNHGTFDYEIGLDFKSKNENHHS